MYTVVIRLLIVLVAEVVAKAKYNSNQDDYKPVMLLMHGDLCEERY